MKCSKEMMLLYAVTDRMWTGKQTLMEQVEDTLKGGATCVQLREKELDEDAFLQEAMEMKTLCEKYHVPFFVNDNVEIAIKCRADGIHVGQEDMDMMGADPRLIRIYCGLEGADNLIADLAQALEGV